jgi:amino acid transporter/nucleotide-binding universal stress UspA family protein
MAQLQVSEAAGEESNEGALPSQPRSANERAVHARGHEAPTHQLSSLLVWAVVFCDIGTSVYYVPGILYSQVGALTPFFVLVTTLGFLLLSVKYVEISWRNPEGGGVVTVATKAFNPRWGCLGGMLITVDYFLTSAISSVSGMQYLGSLFPFIDSHIVPLSICALGFLAIVNIIGIRESALLSLFMACAALLINFVVIGCTLAYIGPPEWQLIVNHLQSGNQLTIPTFLVGFGGAWLAFSGLESISQLSPAMRAPTKSTARNGMFLVVTSILLTVPLLTLFSVALLPDAVKLHETERFISELGGMWGGLAVKVLVVGTASVLLLFAANTAIIGGYHVFLALAVRGFLPAVVTYRNRRFGTPHFAIGVTTLVPMLVITLTGGQLTLLGEMYAFGLLGAFVLSSAGLDVIRWRQYQRGVGFWVGVVTTIMVLVAWSVNLVTKQLATFFGGGLVAFGMAISVATQQGRFSDLFYRIPFVARLTQRHISEAEQEIEDIPHLISLSDASDLVPLYPSRTLVAVRGRNLRLIDEAIAREKGWGGNVIYALYVEERAGLFVGSEEWKPNIEAIETLRFASKAAQRQGFELIPVWTISYNAAEAIARAARVLEVDTVVMGVSRRSAIYHLLRGHVVNGLTRRLPSSCHLLLYS